MAGDHELLYSTGQLYLRAAKEKDDSSQHVGSLTIHEQIQSAPRNVELDPFERAEGDLLAQNLPDL